MRILVANLGSTSFKYRLFEMADESTLARGGVERIGQADARCYATIRGGEPIERVGLIADHGEAIEACLSQLSDPASGCMKGLDELGAIGFKAVHARQMSGVRIVDDAVLSAMEAYGAVAPAHNPAYVAAMRSFRKRNDRVPLVAAFETGFHRTIPESRQVYGVPYEWAERYGVRRYGFHGASHRYIGWRVPQLVGRSGLRIISCHLGGSSSLCAIRAGESVGNSFGMTPQSGLFHNNRVGEFDPFALKVLMAETGRSLDSLLEDLSNKGGLLGISGVSNDLRDVEEAAGRGNARARLAIDAFVEAIRRDLGSFLVYMNGVDVIAFTGGIGENSPSLRTAVCAELDFAGIGLDAERNGVRGGEHRISADGAAVEIWTVPTNEELIVARQAEAAVASRS